MALELLRCPERLDVVGRGLDGVFADVLELEGDGVLQPLENPSKLGAVGGKVCVGMGLFEATNCLQLRATRVITAFTPK